METILFLPDSKTPAKKETASFADPIPFLNTLTRIMLQHHAMGDPRNALALIEAGLT